MTENVYTGSSKICYGPPEGEYRGVCGRCILEGDCLLVVCRGKV